MPARILLVEDSREARAVLAMILRQEGFAVFEAEDGLAALQMIDSAFPDLIITDLQMPNLDGIELIKALRGEPRFSKTPILVVSALCSEANSVRVEREAGFLAIGVGANAIAEKPIQVDYLIDMVRHLLPPMTA